MTAATVLVPTHNHGPLLGYAVRSALRQTVEDIEVFIVGDGATEETDATARDLAESDPRVRFFAFPKGEHHGEVHRDTAIGDASAPIIFYLSDDDLWFPTHVEHLLGLLEEADFAHSTGVRVSPDGSIHLYPGDLADPFWREFIQTRGNFIPLHAAAHTVDLYERSARWGPPEEGTWSDVAMWRKLLAVPGCRAVSGLRPTSLHLTSNRRGDVPPSERLQELRGWSERLAAPGGPEDISAAVLSASIQQVAAAEARRRSFAGEIALLRAGESAAAEAHQQELEAAKSETERARTERDALAASVRSMRSSRTWRLRNAVLRVPLLGGLLRTVGTARFRRGAR